MDIDNLASNRQSLISVNNPEWSHILSLRILVRHEFKAHGFLTLSTYEAVLDWKLRKQRKRTEKHREENSSELIKELTGVYWRIKHESSDKELDIKLAVLTAIPSVGIGIASAILALSHPEDYAIIDFRNWKVLYNEEKRQFSSGDYKKYLAEVREIAKKLDCDVQEVDYLLWKAYE